MTIPEIPKKFARVRPSPDEIKKACDVYGNWQVHMYHLLYFHVPRLTEPGQPARPFWVGFNPKHIGCLQLNVPADPDYNFSILATMTDEAFMEKCLAIYEALMSSRQKVNTLSCCPLAKIRGCVCTISFECVVHGTKCHGTHD